MYNEKDLQELEQFFKKVDLPREIEIMPSQKVVDVRKFIENHLTVARANIGVNAFLSFYDRLIRLKELLQNKKPL